MSQMFADILSIKVFETSEALGMKKDHYRNDFGFGQSGGLFPVYLSIAELMFFLRSYENTCRNHRQDRKFQ